jgi:hypothetical protein
MVSIQASLWTLGMAFSGWAFAGNYPEVSRPIDDFAYNDKVQGVSTLRDTFQEAGNFPLGKALYTIGRSDLLGLNPSLNSFEVSTLETPLGGNFPVQEEQEIQFKSARATRTSVFDQPSRYEQRRAAQRSQIQGYRSSDALLGRLGSF